MTVEDAFLWASRQVGLDDELNPANWQELLRWYIRSKLDPASLMELHARQHPGSGTAHVRARMRSCVRACAYASAYFHVPFSLCCAVLCVCVYLCRWCRGASRGQ